MKVRCYGDLYQNKERLEKSIPKLKQMIQENLEFLPEVKDSYTLRKVLSLQKELFKNKGILIVINELEKQN